MAALFCSLVGAKAAQAASTAQTSPVAQTARTTQTPQVAPDESNVATITHVPTDVVGTGDGNELKIKFFGHASIAFEYEGRQIYVDPVSEYADYGSLPKADAIFVTHSHGDHLDPVAIAALSTPRTMVVCNAYSERSITGEVGKIMPVNPGDEFALSLPVFAAESGSAGSAADATRTEIGVEVVPAYNISPEQLQFHPREQNLCGYIFTIGGSRIYVAGDSEDTPEMLALRDIDIAFLPVNQPYTMKEEQAARAVRAIRPTIFYPYHYGGTDHTTDLEKLARFIDGTGVEMRIRPLE